MIINQTSHEEQIQMFNKQLFVMSGMMAFLKQFNICNYSISYVREDGSCRQPEAL